MTEGVDFWPRGAYILSMKNEAMAHPKGSDLVKAEAGATCDTCHAPAVVVDLNAPDGAAFHCDARGFCANKP